MMGAGDGNDDDGDDGGGVAYRSQRCSGNLLCRCFPRACACSPARLRLLLETPGRDDARGVVRHEVWNSLRSVA